MFTDASTDPALDAAIRAIPSWQGAELEIIPIAEGRTNRNFRVTADDDAFFLRLSEKSTELLGIDRTAEQDSVRAAAEAGVMLVIDSDAHGADTLENIRYGVDTARRAWVRADQVANTRSWSKLNALRKRGKGR